MEKARTVPDSYPLTLNMVVAGCNQKTSRDPLMSIDEAQAQLALDALKSIALVFESSGGRATRYEHNFQRVAGVPEQSAALLGLLMLRGPQTSGELRINTERWHRFADISSVEGFLEEMQDRPEDKGGPLVVKLPRAPGAREQRWAHLLGGPVEAAASAPAAGGSAPGDGAALSTGELAHLQTRLGALEAEVSQLRGTVQRLCAELGLSQPGQTE
ncbi:YceH family protein [Variovorax sp. CYS-02]|uniref:YceH family protein n=2 Tax=Variovorax terrae TaxID=2923278 RepID=A0A9X2APC8_9BURK|nr:YceH family protein [Variovorax terrae]